MPAKAKPKEPVVEKVEEEARPLYEASRKVLLAAIGAVALAQDEIEDFVDKLVERGEIADKDGRTLVHEVLEKRKKTRRAVEEEASKRLRDVLDHLNVPSRKEINDLSAKIEALTKKIEELGQK